CFRCLKSRQPTWRAKREMVASDTSSAAASWAMLINKKLSLLRVMYSRTAASLAVSLSGIWGKVRGIAASCAGDGGYVLRDLFRRRGPAPYAEQARTVRACGRRPVPAARKAPGSGRALLFLIVAHCGAACTRFLRRGR